MQTHFLTKLRLNLILTILENKKNIFRAYVSNGNHIKDRFKKWTDAKIITENKDLKIKLRITGD